MSKAKLTIKTTEMDAFASAFNLADIKVLQSQKIPGDQFNKVEIGYKLEQQLVEAGRYVESILSNSTSIEQKINLTENKKQNEHKNKINKGSRNKQG